MNVPTGHLGEELDELVWQGLGLSLDKEDSLVLEGTGPVCVDLQLAANVLGDDENLRQVLVHEVLQMSPLLIRYDQLGPLLRLQPHALQGVVLDELHPGQSVQLSKEDGKKIISALRHS